MGGTDGPTGLTSLLSMRLPVFIVVFVVGEALNPRSPTSVTATGKSPGSTQTARPSTRRPIAIRLRPSPQPTVIPTQVPTKGKSLLLPFHNQTYQGSSSGQTSTSRGLATGDLIGLVVGLVILVVGCLCLAYRQNACRPRQSDSSKAKSVTSRPAVFQPYLARQSANATMMGSVELRTPSQRKGPHVALQSPSPQVQRAMGGLQTPCTPYEQ